MTLFVICILNGGKINFEISSEYFLYYFSDNIDFIVLSDTGFSVIKAILLMCLMMIALCLLQMIVALISKPILGFLTTTSLLFVSTIWFSPISIGNFVSVNTEDDYHSSDVHEIILLVQVTLTESVRKGGSIIHGTKSTDIKCTAKDAGVE